MLKLTLEQFITRAKKVHADKYNYANTIYTGSQLKINIDCLVHGMFSQTANVHLRGAGCPKCGDKLKSKAKKELAKMGRTDVSNISVPLGSKALPLTNGNYALVDEEDYERVNQYNWHLGNKYVVGFVDGKRVSLHRFIMDVTHPKIFVDHKFHNTLDNRKSQLRICNSVQNGINSRPQEGGSSEYKGVYWSKRNKKWKAQVRYEGIRYHLGYFEKETNAALAYDSKAKELHGEFAYLNFE